MNNKNLSQRIGGIAAILEAILYILGILILFTIFLPTTDETTSSIEKLQHIIDYKLIYQTWMLLICIVFGVVLVPLVVSINENFKRQITLWTQITPIFGFIWSGLIIASGMIAVIGIDTISNSYEANLSSALTSWQTIEIIQYGLGGGIEIVGGIWVFLISMSSIKQRTFNKYLNYFGLFVGGIGILTMIPMFKELGIIFGMTQIIWFIWIGITMTKMERKMNGFKE